LGKRHCGRIKTNSECRRAPLSKSLVGRLW
jgi:hypothetical protein